MPRLIYDDVKGAFLAAFIASVFGYSFHTLYNKPQNPAVSQNQHSVAEPSPSLDEAVKLLLQQNNAAPGISNIIAVRELRMPPDNNLGNFIFEFYSHLYLETKTRRPVPISIDYVAHAYNSSSIVNPPDARDEKKMIEFLMGNDFDGIKVVPESMVIRGRSYYLVGENLPQAIIRRNKDGAAGTETTAIEYNFPIDNSYEPKTFPFWDLSIGDRAISDIGDYIVMNLIERHLQPIFLTAGAREAGTYNPMLALKNNLEVHHNSAIKTFK